MWIWYVLAALVLLKKPGQTFQQEISGFAGGFGIWTGDDSGSNDTRSLAMHIAPNSAGTSGGGVLDPLPPDPAVLSKIGVRLPMVGPDANPPASAGTRGNGTTPTDVDAIFQNARPVDQNMTTVDVRSKGVSVADSTAPVNVMLSRSARGLRQ